ncbi:NAD regulator [Parvularcula flava]|uniref:NAD regulator n=1 Tax=Aquisalinus luteolus TaxID=1566827 RepID=A0A8J3EQ40_9PROT|nr:NAD regulator [Aquisalinus luteolus]NHK28940.1 NAD regulator [Aquisalinus luteolus]GGI00794.1 NAD regulator [Aquisalinus luteolus]
MNKQTSANSGVIIGLNAVLAAIQEDRPLVLSLRSAAARPLLALPYGAFSPDQHRTFELGLREFVSQQTGMQLGYVEQLYTFGDKGREAPSATFEGGKASDRIISVGYLALAPRAAPVEMANTAWTSWYDFFPWEDWRNGEPAILAQSILPGFAKWIAEAGDKARQARRRARVRLAFGYEDAGWEEERVLDRYELMYEAALVSEAWRDEGQDRACETGTAMISDHRRILATAIGRLRGKLRYRPVIFEMMDDTFTLLDLQRGVESIIGFTLHKQNFRRGVENARLVKKTGSTSAETGGRPAALYRVNRDPQTANHDRTIQGLTLPRLRQSPSFPL